MTHVRLHHVRLHTMIVGVIKVIKDYPELRDSALEIQLPMYVHHYKRSTLASWALEDIP